MPTLVRSATEQLFGLLPGKQRVLDLAARKLPPPLRKGLLLKILAVLHRVTNPHGPFVTNMGIDPRLRATFPDYPGLTLYYGSPNTNIAERGGAFSL